jgi:cation diffusion facilitator family transporter
MMSDCCANSACEVEKLRDRQRRTLLWVLWINAALFVTEGTAGLLASSTALTADALDMLGDALIYGFSLYVVSRGALWKARAATLKGWIMFLFGVGVLGQAVYKMLVPELPHYPTIGVVGALALAGNGLCLWLLWRHRTEDINMHSVWLCSRNDIVANVAVLGAGAAVWALHSRWPDILVGLAIAALFLSSSARVLREAARERRAAAPSPGPVLVSLRDAKGP